MDYKEAYDDICQKLMSAYNTTSFIEVKKAIGKIHPELRESEDERIRKALIKGLNFLTTSDRVFTFGDIPIEDIIDYLEKQKENIEKEYVFRPLAGTDITIAAEQAIRKANEGDRLVLAFNGAYIPVRKGCNANKIVDIYDTFIEKQKDASKAIEAVDRIDKYIDEHLANAHDMKDSNPDKKYYRGWDDALGKMAGILQDVYSGEKQKEQKDYNKLYEDIVKSEWFKKAYEGKSLGCDYKQKEQKPILEVFGFKVGDAVRLKDGDGRKHIIKSFEKIEGVHGPDFYHVEFEDNSARDGIYPGEEYPNGYYTQMEKLEEEQKPSKKLPKEEYVKKFKALCDIYEIKLPNREYDIYWLCEDLHKLFGDIQKPAENIKPKFKIGDKIKLSTQSDSSPREIVEIKDNAYFFDSRVYVPFEKQDVWEAVDWSEEDEKMLDKVCCLISPGTILNAGDADYCLELKQWIVSLQERIFKLSRTQPKQEWSEEDEHRKTDAIYFLETAKSHYADTSEIEKTIVWLKSLRPDSYKNCNSRWSDEDNNRINNICDFISGRLKLTESAKEDTVRFLRSLRPSWKPSEEQMDALESAQLMYAHGLERGDIAVVLESLYNDLKGLM